jgi:hypothetical protein
MTPEKSDQSPIDPAELEMHARLEILAGNAQNNLHLRSYGGLTAHLGG